VVLLIENFATLNAPQNLSIEAVGDGAAGVMSECKYLEILELVKEIADTRPGWSVDVLRNRPEVKGYKTFD
jgi:hypothetical protein